MGSQDRDYWRDRPSTGAGESLLPGVSTVTGRLIMISVVAFFGSLLLPWILAVFGVRISVETIFAWLGLVPSRALGSGMLWQFVTYPFLHDPRSIFHVLFNMLLLSLFKVSIMFI